MDLEVAEHAYIFGLFQTDGHLQQSSRNRGKLTIELKSTDSQILHDIQAYIPHYSSIYNRSRTTNFGIITTSTLNIFDMEFRKEINAYGIPYGKKSNIVDIPTVPFIELDYFRGIIDGNGSLGFTSAGFPFLSLVTKSEHIAYAYIKFVESIIHKTKATTRNKRDGIFNICVYKEDAQLLAKALYYPNCLSIHRKYAIAASINTWIRPSTMRRKSQ